MVFIHNNKLMLYIILLIYHLLFIIIIITHNYYKLNDEINYYIFMHSYHFYIQKLNQSNYVNYYLHIHFLILIYLKTLILLDFLYKYNQVM